MVRKLKHTDIGDIPVDWELQTFDETFRVLSNNTLSRENLNNRGGAVRNIHYGDILTKFPEVLNCKEEIPYVNELSLLSSSTQLLQDGDIVIADTAEDETVGKVTEVQNLGDSKLVAGLHTIPCRVKKGDFAPGVVRILHEFQFISQSNIAIYNRYKSVINIKRRYFRDIDIGTAI